MNKEAMKQQILETVSEKLGSGYHGTLQKVLKTNMELDGLTIMKDGEDIAPTIYMDPFYKELEEGASIDDVADSILQSYYNARTYKGNFDPTSVFDFNYVKDKLYVQLVNRHSNEELLQHASHALFLDDFAVTVRCIVAMTAEGSASFLVHNKHLDTWQTDSETLLSCALQNTRKMFGVQLIKMQDLIQELCPEKATDGLPACPLWVMTNNRKLAGAATVLFDDMLKSFAEKHGSFYVIFSSIHEVLLIPTPDDSDIDIITRMNQEVNATQVEEDEILGTKAYFYHKDRGFVL